MNVKFIIKKKKFGQLYNFKYTEYLSYSSVGYDHKNEIFVIINMSSFIY